MAVVSGSVNNLRMSKLDRVVKQLVPTKFYKKGWSPKFGVLTRVINARREIADKLCNPDNDVLPQNYPVNLGNFNKESSLLTADGELLSPMQYLLPGLLPKESEMANFQIAAPRDWDRKKESIPLVIQMAGTGDHGYFLRRELIAKRLASDFRMASLLLENPFYGKRKPKLQLRSGLLHVSDLFVMGTALILEGISLIRWGLREGFYPVGVTGLSMGGHMASLVAACSPFRIPAIPCLSWSTSSSVFTRGVLSSRLAWSVLDAKYDDTIEEVGELLGHEPFSVDDFIQLHYSKPLVNINIGSLKLSADLDNLKLGTDKRDIAKRLCQRLNTQRLLISLLDETTHLKNFPIPYDPASITFVIAANDAYIPTDNVANMEQLWQGCKIKRINNCGHVEGFTWRNNVFREEIRQTFETYRKDDES